MINVMKLKKYNVSLLQGALVTPSYKAMCLYGSEYWTYFLPRRVGQETAQELVASDDSMSAKDAKRLGLINDLIEL